MTQWVSLDSSLCAKKVKSYPRKRPRRPCEMLWIPHCLDNRLTDGGKVVSLTSLQSFTPPKLYFSASGTHFCDGLRKPQGLVRLKGSGKWIKTIRLIRSRTRDLPACSAVPSPLRYRVPLQTFVLAHFNRTEVHKGLVFLTWFGSDVFVTRCL
jgi:hypothetical protein